MAKAVLVDTTKCTACRACQVACKQWNKLPALRTTFTGSYENPPDYRGSYTRILFNESLVDGEPRWLFAKGQCMHCTEAACVMVCPTGAMHKSEFGTTVMDAAKCIGCNYCMGSCPFGVIYFDRDKNLARKCDMCYDRMQAGLTPACAKVCATGTLVYGERSEIMVKAQQAVAATANRGISTRIYGQDQVGGLGWIYVLRDTPESYRIPNVQDVPVSARVWDVLFKPARIAAGLALLVGLWANRREAVELAPPPEAKASKSPDSPAGAGK